MADPQRADETADDERMTGDDFARAAEQYESENLLAEFVAFLRENKKWWLIPILLVLLLAGVLIVVSGSAVAPFIYPFF